MTDTSTAVEAIEALALKSQIPRVADDGCEIPFVIVNDNQSIADLEKLLPAPTRKRGNTVLRDEASFCKFVLTHAGTSTCVYGAKNPPAFEAVFNDHNRLEPGWRDHRASYPCPLSVEWLKWTGADGKQMKQADFAKFIEDNALDCRAPDSATMIEISRTLEAKKKVNFASGIRLSNGENELTFEETITGTASKGKVQIPELFTIGIPVLDGGAVYEVTARLRYRIGDGTLTMWFDLVRPHKIMEHAANELWQRIETALNVTVFNGG